MCDIKNKTKKNNMPSFQSGMNAAEGQGKKENE